MMKLIGSKHTDFKKEKITEVDEIVIR